MIQSIWRDAPHRYVPLATELLERYEDDELVCAVVYWAYSSAGVEPARCAELEARSLRLADGAAHVLMPLAVGSYGHTEKALRYLDRVLAYDPVLDSAWEVKMRKLLSIGRVDEALAIGEDLVRRYPCDAFVLKGIGVLHEKRGTIELARRYFERSIGFQAGGPFGGSHVRLGLLELRLGRIEQALQVLREGVSRFPQNASVLAALARVEDIAGNPNEALRLRCRAWSGTTEVLGNRWLNARLASSLRWRPVVTDLRSLDGLIERVGSEAADEDLPPYADEVLALAYCRSLRYRDLDRAVAHARAAVAETGRKDKAMIVTLALVEHERGDVPGAVRLLEEVLESGYALRPYRDQLEAYRRELLPQLTTLGSADAYLRGAREGEAQAVQTLPAQEVEIQRYLDARVALATGQPQRAAALFRDLSHISSSPLVFVGYVESLRAAGRSDDAEVALEQALVRSRGREITLWEAWWDGLSCRPAEQRAEGLTRLRDAFAALEGCSLAFLDDLEWALGRLSESHALNINCGGDDYTSESGKEWGCDRFHRSGYAEEQKAVRISGSVDARLYQQGRSFHQETLHRGYRIPVLPGRYIVTMGFAEARDFLDQPARFDVRLEDEAVIEDLPLLEPEAERIGLAVERTKAVRVDDGFLDIELVSRADQPRICTIEVLAAE